jgi:hypothetical protein
MIVGNELRDQSAQRAPGISRRDELTEGVGAYDKARRDRDAGPVQFAQARTLAAD